MPRLRYKTRVRIAIGLGVLTIALLLVLSRQASKPFPSDHTPEGAYLRIALDVTEDRMKDAFPYLETEAQWASYSIREARRAACARLRTSYPEAERGPLLAAYAPLADAPDGADVFAMFAKQKGWMTRLRRDLSGVAKVEVDGERASVVTAQGTRYPFRKRDNGIYGLTMFTADLLAESERATRDLAVVNAAADDYDHAAHTQ